MAGNQKRFGPYEDFQKRTKTLHLTQKATETPQGSLRADLRRVRAGGRDLPVCEFIEQLLRLDALEWRWDEKDGRPIRMWTVASHAHGVIMLPAAREVQQIMMELALAREVSFSTDIDPATPNVHFMTNEPKPRVC